MKIQRIKPLDVEQFPVVLEEGVLYISEPCELAAHKCCCGCGEDVITPLNPARWRIVRSGEVVSLIPSVGNWKFACRSHYWIRSNQVIQSFDLTDDEVAEVFEEDRQDRDRYIATRGPQDNGVPGESSGLTGVRRRWFGWLR